MTDSKKEQAPPPSEGDSTIKKVKQFAKETGQHLNNRWAGLKAATMFSVKAMSQASASKSSHDKSVASSDSSVSAEISGLILKDFLSPKRLGRLLRNTNFTTSDGLTVTLNGQDLPTRLEALINYIRKEGLPRKNIRDENNHQLPLFKQMFAEVEEKSASPMSEEDLKRVAIIVISNLLIPQNKPQIPQSFIDKLTAASTSWDFDNPITIISSLPADFFEELSQYPSVKNEFKKLLRLGFVSGLNASAFGLKLKDNLFLDHFLNHICQMIFEQPQLFHSKLQEVLHSGNPLPLIVDPKIGIASFLAQSIPEKPKSAQEQKSLKDAAQMFSIFLGQLGKAVHLHSSEYGDLETLEEEMGEFLLSWRPDIEKALKNPVSDYDKMRMLATSFITHINQSPLSLHYQRKILHKAGLMGVKQFLPKITTASSNEKHELLSWYDARMGLLLESFITLSLRPESQELYLNAGYGLYLLSQESERLERAQDDTGELLKIVNEAQQIIMPVLSDPDLRESSFNIGQELLEHPAHLSHLLTYGLFHHVLSNGDQMEHEVPLDVPSNISELTQSSDGDTSFTLPLEQRRSGVDDEMRSVSDMSEESAFDDVVSRAGLEGNDTHRSSHTTHESLSAPLGESIEVPATAGPAAREVQKEIEEFLISDQAKKTIQLLSNLAFLTTLQERDTSLEVTIFNQATEIADHIENKCPTLCKLIGNDTQLRHKVATLIDENTFSAYALKAMKKLPEGDRTKAQKWAQENSTLFQETVEKFLEPSSISSLKKSFDIARSGVVLGNLIGYQQSPSPKDSKDGFSSELREILEPLLTQDTLRDSLGAFAQGLMQDSTTLAKIIISSLISEHQQRDFFETELSEFIRTTHDSKVLPDLLSSLTILIDEDSPSKDKFKAIAPLLDTLENFATTCPNICSALESSPALQKKIGQIFMDNTGRYGYYIQTPEEIGQEVLRSIFKDLRSHQASKQDSQESHRLRELLQKALFRPQVSEFLSWLMSPSILFQYRLPYLPLILTARSIKTRLSDGIYSIASMLYRLGAAIAQSVSELSAQTAAVFTTKPLQREDNTYRNPEKEVANTAEQHVQKIAHCSTLFSTFIASPGTLEGSAPKQITSKRQRYK